MLNTSHQKVTNKDI